MYDACVLVATELSFPHHEIADDLAIWRYTTVFSGMAKRCHSFLYDIEAHVASAGDPTDVMTRRCRNYG